MSLTKLINKIDFEIKETKKNKKIFKNYILIINFFLKKFIFFLIKISILKLRWNIHFTYINKFNFKKINNLDSIKIKNPKNTFLADPFVIKYKNKNLLFAEEFNFNNNKGVISLYELKKNSYKRRGIIIKEKFHLSYPFVINHKNKLYIVPESSESNSLRIYECKRFPNKWILKKVLINNVNAIDPILINKNNIWWLMFNSEKNNFKSLNIYFNKKSLFSNNWKKAYEIKNAGRNGGLLTVRNKAYRVCQSSSNYFYGKKITINELVKLNQNSFKEKINIRTITPQDFNNTILGIHHINNNKEFICFDTLGI